MAPSESLNWYDFLARLPLPASSVSVPDFPGVQPILITGAAGSIGSALARQLATTGLPLLLLDSSESHLFALQSRLAEHRSVTYFLGNVGDVNFLDEIFERYAPKVIFHAAAYKHVPLLEGQPFAAIENNVFTTESLAAASVRHGTRLVLLSTDKAAEPASILGATKHIAEVIVLASGGVALRLGNVLGSRGSVSQTFAAQIAAGGPLTVTHPEARRYFLTVNEAVHLLITAAAEMKPGVLFAPQLSQPHGIADLARFMAARLAPERAIGIEFTSLRAGDKLNEQLTSAAESVEPSGAEGLHRILSAPIDVEVLARKLTALHAAQAARDLPAALEVICDLVPDYLPSDSLRALTANFSSRVLL